MYITGYEVVDRFKLYICTNVLNYIFAPMCSNKFINIGAKLHIIIFTLH